MVAPDRSRLHREAHDRRPRSPVRTLAAHVSGGYGRPRSERTDRLPIPRRGIYDPASPRGSDSDPIVLDVGSLRRDGEPLRRAEADRHGPSRARVERSTPQERRPRLRNPRIRRGDGREDRAHGEGEVREGVLRRDERREGDGALRRSQVQAVDVRASRHHVDGTARDDEGRRRARLRHPTRTARSEVGEPREPSREAADLLGRHDEGDPRALPVRDLVELPQPRSA